MTASVRIEGLDAVMKKVKSLEDMTALKTGLKTGAEHLKEQARKYPPRRYGAKMQFVSDRQRRFFFWALKEGKIQVPYRRGQSPGSQDLANSWTIESSNNNLTWIIGTNVTYAPLVQDDAKQTRMHKLTGWHTVQKIAKHEGQKVVRLISQEVDRLIGR